MKKKIASNLISFIIGGLVFGSIGLVVAISYNASSITYTPIDNTWNVSNVQGAINDLNDKISNKNNKKTIILGCGSFENSGYSIQCNLAGNANTVKKITIKNIEYLNASFYIGYKKINNADSVSFSSINVGDAFDINNQSYDISFYGNAENKYSTIKMELEIEYS